MLNADAVLCLSSLFLKLENFHSLSKHCLDEFVITRFPEDGTANHKISLPSFGDCGPGSNAR